MNRMDWKTIWKKIGKETRRRGAVLIMVLLCFVVSVQRKVGAESLWETVRGSEWSSHAPDWQAEEVTQLYAASAALIDGDSGRLLYGKEEQTPLPMASTTKIMTCILALELADLSDVCEVSANAAAQPNVKLGMRQGEQFYLKDLLYSLMLESHNDTAVCIAEHVAGSTEAFAEKMNEKAGEIGCTQTHFVTPNGLDGEDDGGTHHTTAFDLAQIMRYCLRQSPKAEEFLEITGTSSYSFGNTEGNRSYSCQNHNALLTIYEGAVSGKTGFTAKAGYCYVGAVQREDRLLIVSLLACGWPNHKGYKWVDTKKLMQYGFENFEKRAVTDRTLQTAAVCVTDGQKKQSATRVDWEAQQSSRNGSLGQNQGTEVLAVLMRPQEQAEVRIELAETLTAPVLEGQRVGTAAYLIDGNIYAEYPILAQDTVKKIDFPYCLEQCLELWLIK